MPATREPAPPPSPMTGDVPKWPLAAAAGLVTLGVLVVPLICAPELMDRFRTIKESAARAEAILGLFLVVTAVVLGGTGRLRAMLRERAVVSIAVAGAAWGAITTVASTHRALSIESLVTILTSVALFFVVWYAAPRTGFVVVDLLVPGAIVNSVLSALQRAEIYNPFQVATHVSPHLAATALLGNPNIVGSYLALVAVILAAAAVCTRGWRRLWYVIGALFGIGGVFVSDTETALVTLLAGLGALAVGRSMRRAVAILAGMAILVAAAAALRVPVVTEFLALPQRIRTEGLEVALSGRVAPALVALEMTRERPLLGFGPGTYGAEFMPRRIRLAEESEGRIARGLATNFAEVHNDHLQLLAEGGVPAWLLFLAFVG
ncbi:MAG TPA: O-antigen ligase family protein, partial [Thermoanaerobaculia bacterium]|nr:O-antigen ligase family protein [Thermoanaerobaculia bacterium]